MIALCPSCWRVVPVAADRCPTCRADLRGLDEREYGQKLVGALDHPDRETVMRVAAILTARQDESASPSLIAALKRYWSEPYVAAAIVQALGQLPGSAARNAVQEALGHESVIVRAKAELALHEYGGSRLPGTVGKP